MAKVIGYLNDKVVYEEECKQEEVNEYIVEAFSSWESISDMNEIHVTVIDDDGSRWSPV